MTTTKTFKAHSLALRAALCSSGWTLTASGRWAPPAGLTHVQAQALHTAAMEHAGLVAGHGLTTPRWQLELERQGLYER